LRHAGIWLAISFWSDSGPSIGAAYKMIFTSIAESSLVAHYQPPVDIDWQRVLRH
jgi:hypothetical protein